MGTKIQKRSWRRALARAIREGHSWYRGRILTASHARAILHSDVVPASVPKRRRHTCATTSLRVRPGEQARAGRLTYFNWNAGGLATPTWDSLMEYMCLRQIDIATIQETRWSFDGEWTASGYHCIHSASAEDKGQAGVLTCIRCSLCPASALRLASVWPGRLLHVRAPVGQNCLDIINMYQYFLPGDLGRGLEQQKAAELKVEKREKLLHALAGLLGLVPYRNCLLVAGDFNASLSSSSSLVGPAVQPLSKHATDETLQSIIEAYQLCCLNTWQSRWNYSCQGPQGSRTVIDYVMIRNIHADASARQVKYLYESCLFSGPLARHIPFIGTVPRLWRCWKGVSKSSSMCNVEKFLHDASITAPTYLAFLQEVRETVCQAKSASEINNLVLSLAQRFYPAAKTSPNKFLDSKLRGLVHQGWALRRQLRSVQGTGIRAVLLSWFYLSRILKHRRFHRRDHRLHKQQCLEQLIQEAALASAQGRQRDLHSVIRKLSPKIRRKNMSLRGPKGQLLTPDEENLAIREHMLASFHDSQAGSLEPRMLHELPFSEIDLRQMLSNTPARKAAPVRSCPSAFIKKAAEVIAPRLYTLLGREWKSTYALVPPDWRTSWLCWIPKPGKPLTSMNDFRGISLQDVVGKAVLKSVTLHARSQCHSQLLAWPQYGYMKGRSTADAILKVYLHELAALRISALADVTPHQRHAGFERAELIGGIQLCLDVSMAFDRVPRLVLEEALLQMRMAEDLVALIINWHIDTTYCSGDIAINANRGVRQGCVAAPLVWIVYTMLLMQKLALYIPLVCVLAWLTMYADDMHWGQTFKSESELREVLHLIRSFLDFLAIFGVVVNMQKSAILLHVRGRRAAKWRAKLLRSDQGQRVFRLPAISKDDQCLQIPLVKEHTYLGVKLGYHKTQRATFLYRAKLARGNFIRLRKWWGRTFPLEQRMRLWKQVIWPSLTYGLWDIGLNPAGQHQFSVLVHRQWRHLARNPVHITRDSHQTVRTRLGVAHPLTMLATDVCRRWLRRIDLTSDAPSHDIQHVVLGMCVQEQEYEQSPLRRWLQLCLTRCHQHIDLDPALYKRLPELAAFMNIAGWNEVPAEPPLAADAENLATEGLACPLCNKRFAHQMALRRHMRALHEEETHISKTTFDPRKHALGGLPTCRFCKLVFRQWQGLKKHIENQVCIQSSAGELGPLEPYQLDEIPACQNPDILDILKTQGAAALAEYPDWCAKLAHHCCLCNQWFSLNSALGYHQQTHHREVTMRGRAWAKSHVQAGVFKFVSPCRWCGQGFAQSTSHKCPVINQLGILHSFFDDGGCRDDFGGLSRSDPEDVWKSSSKSWQTTRVSRQRGWRQKEVKTKHFTKSQKGSRRRAQPTLALHGHGATSSQTRRLDQPCQTRHDVSDVLGHFLGDVTGDAGHLSQMEVRKGKWRPHTRAALANYTPCQRLHGARQQPCKLGGRTEGQTHCGVHGDGHLGQGRALHQEGLQREDQEDRAGPGSHGHCGGAHYHTETSTRLHDHRPCYSLSFDETLSRGVCERHLGVPTGALAEASVRRPVLSGPISPLRDQHSRANEMQDETFDATEVSTCYGYPQADAEPQQGSQVVEVQHLHRDIAGDTLDDKRYAALTDMEVRPPLCNPGGITAEDKCDVMPKEATARPRRPRIEMDRLPGASAPLTALQIWRTNGRGCLAPCLRNPDVVCYMNSTISCLLICHDNDQEAMSDWGVIDELFQLAATQPIDALPALACMQRVFQTWPQVHRQHDVKEFLDHLRSYVPILNHMQTESRMMLPEGLLRQDEEFRLIAPTSSASTACLQELIRTWHTADAGIKGCVGMPALLVLTIPRFNYEAGAAVRLGGRIGCEPGRVQIPCFCDIVTLALQWVDYKVVCCILHRGIGLDSGHYMYLALGEDGYIFGADASPAVYYAFPPEQYSGEICMVFLQKLVA